MYNQETIRIIKTFEKYHEPFSSLQLVIGLDFEWLNKHFEQNLQSVSVQRLNLTLISYTAPHSYLSPLMLRGTMFRVSGSQWKRCQHHERRQREFYLLLTMKILISSRSDDLGFNRSNLSFSAHYIFTFEINKNFKKSKKQKEKERSEMAKKFHYYYARILYISSFFSFSLFLSFSHEIYKVQKQTNLLCQILYIKNVD